MQATQTSNPSSDERYLQPTPFLDSDHPEIQQWAHETVQNKQTPTEQAIALFSAVRDQIFYNPYQVELLPENFQASTTLRRGRAFCVPKAILLAAGARVIGIPSRLGFADVKNHLATKRLLEIMRTDIFAYHGYTELWLEQRWVKVSPTFNQALCELLDVAPLEFDGVHDALLQEYNLDRQRHMEYLCEHGTSADFAIKPMLEVWRQRYPHFFPKSLIFGESELNSFAISCRETRRLMGSIAEYYKRFPQHRPHFPELPTSPPHPSVENEGGFDDSDPLC